MDLRFHFLLSLSILNRYLRRDRNKKSSHESPGLFLYALDRYLRGTFSVSPLWISWLISSPQTGNIRTNINHWTAMDIQVYPQLLTNLWQERAGDMPYGSQCLFPSWAQALDKCTSRSIQNKSFMNLLVHSMKLSNNI